MYTSGRRGDKPLPEPMMTLFADAYITGLLGLSVWNQTHSHHTFNWAIIIYSYALYLMNMIFELIFFVISTLPTGPNFVMFAFCLYDMHLFMHLHLINAGHDEVIPLSGLLAPWWRKSTDHWWHDDVIKWKHFPRYWPLCGEFTGHRWIPRTKASDAELWCFLWSAPE